MTDFPRHTEGYSSIKPSKIENVFNIPNLKNITLRLTDIRYAQNTFISLYLDKII